MFIVIVSLITSLFLPAIKEGAAALWEAAWEALGSAGPAFSSWNPLGPTVIISVVLMEEQTLRQVKEFAQAPQLISDRAFELSAINRYPVWPPFEP